jgi:hypothetical protein
VRNRLFYVLDDLRGGRCPGAGGTVVDDASDLRQINDLLSSLSTYGRCWFAWPQMERDCHDVTDAAHNNSK